MEHIAELRRSTRQASFTNARRISTASCSKRRSGWNLFVWRRGFDGDYNLAQRFSGEPVHTFTLAFEEEEYNEAIRARRIADALGTQHHEWLLTEWQFVTQLEEALGSLDQPTLEGINCYYISRSVREAGFKVAIAGVGGR